MPFENLSGLSIYRGWRSSVFWKCCENIYYRYVYLGVDVIKKKELRREDESTKMNLPPKVKIFKVRIYSSIRPSSKLRGTVKQPRRIVLALWTNLIEEYFGIFLYFWMAIYRRCTVVRFHTRFRSVGSNYWADKLLNSASRLCQQQETARQRF